MPDGVVSGSAAVAGRTGFVGALILLLIAGRAPADAAQAPGPGAPNDIRRDATVAAVEKVMPSVVNVGTIVVERRDPYEEMLRQFFGYRQRSPNTIYSSGSGVVIDEEGWVLTNLHVVRGASQVVVTLHGFEEPLEAEVVSTSEGDDLALLRLKAPEGTRFQAIRFAADDDLLLGETVLALGNPYGLGGSVSRGILSSKTRRPDSEGAVMEVEDWLQTDASINPGNSGGPLVNLRGELIGLNVAILAQAQGIGFAIPVKRISAALARMFSPEATRGLWFGAVVQGVRPPVVVKEVQPGSPADRSGLEPRDEIVAVNGTPVESLLQFQRELTRARDARIEIRRDGRPREVRVRLVEESSVFNAEYIYGKLGLELEPVPDELRRALRMDLSGAQFISAVRRGSAAEKVGLTRGQIVLRIGGVPPVDTIAVGRLLNGLRPGASVELDILSGRRRGMLLEVQEHRVKLPVR